MSKVCENAYVVIHELHLDSEREIPVLSFLKKIILKKNIEQKRRSFVVARNTSEV